MPYFCKLQHKSNDSAHKIAGKVASLKITKWHLNWQEPCQTWTCYSLGLNALWCQARLIFLNRLRGATHWQPTTPARSHMGKPCSTNQKRGNRAGYSMSLQCKHLQYQSCCHQKMLGQFLLIEICCTVTEKLWNCYGRYKSTNFLFTSSRLPSLEIKGSLIHN